MEIIVRAVDVGFGNTKFVTDATGGKPGDIRCASFPSRAYPRARDPSKTLGGEGRKTFAIPIDGLFYEVGPDVMLAADAFRATQIHGDYIDCIGSDCCPAKNLRRRWPGGSVCC